MLFQYICGHMIIARRSADEFLKNVQLLKNQISPCQLAGQCSDRSFPLTTARTFLWSLFFLSLDGWLVKSIECAAWGFYPSVCKWLKELLTHLQQLIRSCLTAEILLSFQSLNAVSQSFPQYCKCRTGGNAAFCAYMQSYWLAATVSLSTIQPFTSQMFLFWKREVSLSYQDNIPGRW